MANNGNQKIKLLRVLEMLWNETDETHRLSMSDILERLDELDLKTERKSVYNDLEVLRTFGLDIMQDGRRGGYYLASRTFELAELKLLADAVSASKFITEKKSRALVKKLGTLGSTYDGRQLQRQVVVTDRVKAGNEKIYYTIDTIYACIDENRQMTFRYAEWNADKKLVLRKDGAVYRVSPVFLLWDNENYYLVAYSEDDGEIRHYRVDKIVKAKMGAERQSREAKRQKLRPSDYSKKTFGMFAGEEETVTLECAANLAGVLIDRFGSDVVLRDEGETLTAHVHVQISPQFFGWLAGLGSRVRIVSPEDVAAKYQAHLAEILEAYRNPI